MTRVFQLLCINMLFAYISILSRFLRVELFLRYVYLIYVFSRKILFLLLTIVFSILIIQFRSQIEYFSIKVNQMNKSSHENKLNIASLTFVDVIYIIKKKKVLALLKRHIEETYIFSFLIFFKFVDNVRRLRLFKQ